MEFIKETPDMTHKYTNEEGIYVIYDKTAEAVKKEVIFVDKNDGMAERRAMAIMDGKMLPDLNSFPEQFSLIKIAKINLVTGEIISENRTLGDMTKYKKGE